MAIEEIIMTKEERLLFEKEQKYKGIIKHFNDAWLIYLFGIFWVISVIAFTSIYFASNGKLSMVLIIFLGVLSFCLLFAFLLSVYFYVRKKHNIQQQNTKGGIIYTIY